ncbi:MAG: hypothetical protein ABC588_08595 [Candidatus Methanosuratincola petrocarbonis]
MSGSQCSQDGGVRLYTVSAFKHLKSKSIFYRSRVSRSELLDALYEVLLQADVVSIRRVEDAPEGDPATEKQIRRMEREHQRTGIPLPEGFPRVSKAKASEYISRAKDAPSAEARA